jgi:hypothetical protein
VDTGRRTWRIYRTTADSSVREMRNHHRKTQLATSGKSRSLQMMNGSKTYSFSGGFRAPNPKRRRPGPRVSRSPSPHPSPQGEGETFARALIIRPSLVVLCLRNERQRGGDCNHNIRIPQRRRSVLPLLGERVGVRGNEVISNPKAHDTPELSNFASPPGGAGSFPI